MAFCNICNNPDGSPMEFPTVKELSEHIKGGHKIQPKIEVPLPPPPKPVNREPTPVKPKPLELLYKYIGGCIDCGREVETLLIDISASDQRAIAYCLQCKKECKQTNVIPISKQKIKSSSKTD